MRHHSHDQYVGFNIFLATTFKRWATTCPQEGVRPPPIKALKVFRRISLPVCRTTVQEGKRQLRLSLQG